MNHLHEGAEIIRRAEEGLRGVLARAAEGAAYDDLPILTDWARKLRALLDEGIQTPLPAGGRREGDKGLPPVAPQGDAFNGSATRPVRLDVAGAVAPARRARKGAAKRGRTPKRSRKPSRSRKTEYPQFLREGEALVKIGWSKREKAPYEHRAPKRVLQLLVESLLRVGGSGQRFTTDDVLPLREEGTEIPTYQSYLTLAWLREVGLIVQHGRQGYSLLPGANLTQESDRLWNLLPAR